MLLVEVLVPFVLPGLLMVVSLLLLLLVGLTLVLELLLVVALLSIVLLSLSIGLSVDETMASLEVTSLVPGLSSTESLLATLSTFPSSWTAGGSGFESLESIGWLRTAPPTSRSDKRMSWRKVHDFMLTTARRFDPPKQRMSLTSYHSATTTYTGLRQRIRDGRG